MGLRRSAGSLEVLVEAASQRQAYNFFRKARVFFGKVVMRTPVLSGAMRDAWWASYDIAEYRFTDVKNKRHITAPRAAPSFPLTYDRNRAWHIFITNGAPYARKIEDGWSQQAPLGIVRLTKLEVFGVPG